MRSARVAASRQPSSNCMAALPASAPAPAPAPSEAAELVPTLSSLEPVYGAGAQLDEARLRFARLGDRFHAVYAARPALFARSPGPSASVPWTACVCLS